VRLLSEHSWRVETVTIQRSFSSQDCIRVRLMNFVVLRCVVVLLLAGALPLAAFAQDMPPQVERLLETGSAAVANRQYQDAITAFEKALPLLEPGKVSNNTRAEIVLSLAQAQLSVSNLSAAQQLLEKDWPVITAHPDPERLDRGLYFMMFLLLQKADYVAAATFSDKLLARATGRLGPEHPQTLGYKLNHGSALVNAGKPEEGLKLLDAALNGIQLQKSTAQYLDQIYGVGNALENTQQYAAAARYYQRFVEAAGKLPESRDTGVVYQKLAVMKSRLGQWQEALPHYEKAVEILDKTTGPDDVTAIASVGGLGVAFVQLGRPASGLQFLERAHDRARMVLGEDNDETWTHANNLADALRELERFQEAYVLDLKVYDWQVKNRPEDQDAIETSLMNTGLDLMGMKRMQEAGPLFAKLNGMRKARLGADHPKTKAAKEFLRLYENNQPRRKAAEIATLSAFEANAEGIALSEKGMTKAALPFYRRAFEASVVESGPYNPTTLILQRNLALLEMKLDPTGIRATPVYQDLSRRTLTWARTEIAATAGKVRSEDIRRFANHMIYDVIKLAQRNPQAHHVLFQVLMDWKGLGTTEQALLNRLRSQPPDDVVAQLVTRYEAVQKSLRTPGTQVEQQQSELDRLEAKLAEASVAFGRLRADAGVMPRDVIARLKPDEVLVDYIIGDRELQNSNETVQELFAFVTLADGRAIVKDLGKLDAIKSVLSTLGFESNPEARARLFELLLKPVLAMKSVKNKKHFYIVPDGELFLVPFEGLLDANGKAFASRADITLMRSATGLLKDSLKPKTGGVMLLVGAPDYGKEQSALSFPALPGALQEVKDIEALAKVQGYKSSILTGQSASEADVRQAAAGKSIIHMATHGFFLESTFDPSLEPPWRGGLALKDANAASPEGLYGDEGVAYAAEMANWPLGEADLVVLSACETGSGERSYVEGLRGIPAALATAGAKYSLLAYWTVPDVGTANFMTSFYRNLFARSMSYEDAFRTTKRAAINGEIAGAEAPEVWQAFVLMRN
jgi:CHAT domain-containing protein/tetratricopeptide (TPR) repeat protein